MKIFMIEHRERLQNREEIDFDSVVMHVASSEPKALRWCQKKENLAELETGEDGKAKSWYAIIEETVDGKLTDQRLIGYINTKGELVQMQPGVS